jgi:hypothetical protein
MTVVHHSENDVVHGLDTDTTDQAIDADPARLIRVIRVHPWLLYAGHRSARVTRIRKQMSDLKSLQRPAPVRRQACLCTLD